MGWMLVRSGIGASVARVEVGPPVRGRTRILTKIAHSIVKPLYERLYKEGKNECNGEKCCTNCAKYTLERLFTGTQTLQTRSNFRKEVRCELFSSGSWSYLVSCPYMTNWRRVLYAAF